MTKSQAAAPKVVPFPARDREPSSTQKIWGKPVLSHGYTSIPSILIQAQRRLGISPLQLNIILQLLDFWRDPNRKPFPTKRQIAERIGIGEKSVQTNVGQLEKAGLIRREIRKTASGDYNSNIYDLDGLVDRIKQLEPDFAAAREQRKQASKFAQTPAGRRSQP